MKKYYLLRHEHRQPCPWGKGRKQDKHQKINQKMRQTKLKQIVINK